MARFPLLLALPLCCAAACSGGSTDSSSGVVDDHGILNGEANPAPRSSTSTAGSSPSGTPGGSAPSQGGAPGVSSAPANAPRVVDGNPASCAAVIQNGGTLLTFKIDPAKSGTYTSPDGVLVITVTASEKTFSFTSNVPLEWVIVKGGPAANIYEFSTPVTGATGLVAPKGLGLSHLDFCYPPGGNGGSGGSGNGGAANGGSGNGGAANGGAANGGSGHGGATNGGASNGGNSQGGASGGTTGTGGSGSGSCPPNYQIWLSTEGASVCTPIPFEGQCPAGYLLDTVSEGKYCIPGVPK